MIALLAALALLADPAPAGRTLNQVAALVNGDVITLRELQERAGPAWRQIEAQAPGPARDRARVLALKASFDAVVAEKLIDAQAKELGVEVADAEVEGVISDTKKRYRLDDEMLDRALAAEGTTRQAYRDRVRRDLEGFRVVQARVRARIKVTDEDIQNYYRQHPDEFLSGQEVRVRHIFFQLTASAPPEEEARVKARAEKALERARAGQDFAALAKELSQGPSAADGGDLGWLRKGVVQPEVERVAFALEPGGISDLVRTRNGIQILKVEARRGGDPRPFDQVKDEIRDKLTNNQADALRDQYVAELRKDALIEIRLPELKQP